MTLRFEVDQIDVTMLGGNWKYDPDWRYVDKAGHHHWVLEGIGVFGRFPTLLYIIDSVYLDRDGEPQQDGHLCCSLCYEPIEPGRVPAPSTILGMKHWYLDDVEITEAEANAHLEAAR